VSELPSLAGDEVRRVAHRIAAELAALIESIEPVVEWCYFHAAPKGHKETDHCSFDQLVFRSSAINAVLAVLRNS